MSAARAGVDVGGTFTDVVVLDGDGGLSAAKVTSDPARLDEAVVDGLGKASAGPVGAIGHGTTLATNVTLERSGPRVGLLCTEGFRDVLEIARLSRPAEKLYALKDVMPAPLVARRDSFGVPERVDAGGRAVRPLDEEAVRAAARTLAARDVRDVAVCFLHAYRNPGHERRAREVLREELPDARVSLSSDVWSESREYERASTTALNAYLRPAVERYLDRLGATVAAAHPEASLWMMQSNGGLTSPAAAGRLPVRLVLSGPAGGVIAAQWAAERAGYRDAIAVDMGGTSFDASVVRDGRAHEVEQLEVMGLPVRGRAPDILTIGAGGGSIAWADEGGQFRVGPRSAGAHPGPACYGRGGEEATVTDANLVLGHLSGAAPLGGGELELDLGAALRACERLGRRLGLSAVEAAWGIRRIVNTAMAGAVAAMTLRRGIDPRDHVLLAYGGAGPMHAADIAAELGIGRVVLPPLPGVFSALGICISDAVHDVVRTVAVAAEPAADEDVRRELADLERAAAARLDELAIAPERRRLERSLDMCYRGQNFTLAVPTAAGEGLATARARFDALHEARYGYASAGEPVEVVNVHVRAVGRIGAAVAPRGAAPAQDAPVPAERARAVWDGAGSQPRETPCHARAALAPGHRFQGPALVRSDDATVAVPPGWAARVDPHDNLVLEALA
jgi:N-methylhydantoinase A